jgi:putative zinc finger/helix-turn-helix YgiT family protein
MRCPTCRKSNLRSDTVTRSFSMGNQKFSEESPAEVCNDCGETFYAEEDVIASELARAKLLAGLGSSSPESIKFMRKIAGLNEIEMADLFGVALVTVSRWEDGSLPMERHALALLGCIVIDKVNNENQTVERLREVIGMRSLQKSVQVRRVKVQIE